MKHGFGFAAESLPSAVVETLSAQARQARSDILHMTTLAASGHPGGSMSSIDFYLTIYHCANVDGNAPHDPARDRVVVSHGHTSPGVYSTLIAHGFLNREDVLAGFRQAWSPFEGHIEREVPGVEWSTGNLGQGLSAGCGMALASRVHGTPYRVWVCMGDGEQQKGQLSEARRFAVKYGLTNLTAIVDYNQLQISGDIHQVMPQNIKANWESDGWEVIEVNGHDYQEIYRALRRGTQSDKPVCLLAHTVMGKGVSFMENLHKFHGQPLSEAQCHQALQELSMPDRLDELKALRPTVKGRVKAVHPPAFAPNIDPGTPRTYAPDVKTDNRSAWGTAVAELGKANQGRPGATPLVVFDCDLAESVKTGPFHSACPERFFQAGIQEHHTATMSGAMSTQGIVTFWSDFGVFAVDEAYNQQRLNDINHSHLKTVATHSGLDVGEDGKTHQSIDYVGIMRNIFGYRVYLPADPNETDRIIRYIATRPGNDFVGMGRSKLPIITNEEGQPFFGNDYTFEYGKSAVLREGVKGLPTRAVVFSTGTMTHRAVAAWEMLKAEGIAIRVVHVATPLSVEASVVAEAAKVGVVATYEDHIARTGLGGTVADALIDARLNPKLIRLGVEHYQPSGPAEDVFAAAGLDARSLVARIKAALG